MEIERLIELAPDWTDQTWAKRIDDAASLLFLHGYIPMSQRTKITLKLNRQFQEAIDSGGIVARTATEARDASA